MENEWKTIKYKNKNTKRTLNKKNKNKKISSLILSNERENKEEKEERNEEEQILQFLQQINKIQNNLKQTIFYEELKRKFKEEEEFKQKKIQKIVFLGIGNFLSSNSSCLQLALGLELFTSFNLLDTIENSDNSNDNDENDNYENDNRKSNKIKNNIYIYDPLLTSIELRICSLLNLQVDSSSLNLHIATDMTLFYMPHCPYTLYNQIIWLNWGNNSLSNVIIFGNR